MTSRFLALLLLAAALLAACSKPEPTRTPPPTPSIYADGWIAVMSMPGAGVFRCRVADGVKLRPNAALYVSGEGRYYRIGVGDCHGWIHESQISRRP